MATGATVAFEVVAEPVAVPVVAVPFCARAISMNVCI